LLLLSEPCYLVGPWVSLSVVVVLLLLSEPCYLVGPWVSLSVAVV
jgi:hypothetical protein